MLRHDGAADRRDSFGDCVPFTGDSIAAKVEWKGKPDRSKLERKVIRVKVRARNAKLYSFFFPKGAYTGEYWKFKEISCLDPLRFDLKTASQIGR
ncbi:hypothetical protein PV433_27470 [Paenibacillus sp. GYB004]|uniref:hypothetical protein n=1 Tax=Paenibacillus sp. GYB004 TaxID=2994393 RepID=UPI002F96309C